MIRMVMAVPPGVDEDGERIVVRARIPARRAAERAAGAVGAAWAHWTSADFFDEE